HIYFDQRNTESLKVIFEKSKNFDQDLDAFHRDILACEEKLKYIEFSSKDQLHEQKFNGAYNFDDFAIGMHSGVVLGGTFDRIHNGHKFLLTVAALLAKDKLICGVTDGPMLERKLLYELIEPINRRIQHIREFILDIDASLDFQAVPIYDSFGPSTVEKNLQCIVVSSETIRGASKVNEERSKKGFNELDIHVIDLINDDIKGVIDERKVSSSKIRTSLLGKLIRPS
uniref:Cytidyltransferase-like domain-containing protein n=1 Tax=Romanomermis culicivorax TaxID=13658 RepID=A0A915IRI8_ROMCU